MYDDINIEPGKLRIRPSGSAGGHNGMKNIIYLIDSDEFVRVRFGVGAAKGDLANHVLGRFSEDDGVSVTRAIKNIDSIVEMIVKGNVTDAMSKYNNREL